VTRPISYTASKFDGLAALIAFLERTERKPAWVLYGPTKSMYEYSSAALAGEGIRMKSKAG